MKKTFKLIVINLTLTVLLSAIEDTENIAISPQEFRTEVNLTYYNPEKRIVEIDNEVKFNSKYKAKPWESIKAFDNLENNTTQRALKKEFEHLLAMYLSVEDLYSKEELSNMKTSNIEIFVYRNFYKMLNIYIGHLQKESNQKNRELLYKIVDKNVKNLYQLMENSNNFDTYFFSVSSLENFLESLNRLNDFAEVFKEYSLVKDELFFEKIKLSKSSYLEEWMSHLPKEQRENAQFMQILHRNLIYIDKMVNESLGDRCNGVKLSIFTL